MAVSVMLTATAEPGARIAYLGRVAKFACVGVGSTVLHLGLFAVLLQVVAGSQVANLLALAVATVANTAVNRRWTFGVVGAPGVARHHLQAIVVFGLAWAISAFALWALHTAAPYAQPWVQTAAVAVAMVGSTVVRYQAMRRWIFRS